MRIAIADDDDLLPPLLAEKLPGYGIEVVAVVKTAEAAKQLVYHEPLDLMLLDIEFDQRHSDDTTGLRLAGEIRRTHPDVGLLILSVHAEPAYLRRLLQVDQNRPRAVGYFVKHWTDLPQLVNAIKEVAAGGVSLDALLVETLSRREDEALRNVLTISEIMVIKKLIQGYSNKKIAHDLSISIATVVSHVANISRKSGATTPEGLQREDINVRVRIVNWYLEQVGYL